MYLTISEVAVSAVLLRSEEDAQFLIYYVSHAFVGDESHYSELEKLALVLVLLAKILRSYYLAHTVRVLSDTPLKKVLS